MGDLPNPPTFFSPSSPSRLVSVPRLARLRVLMLPAAGISRDIHTGGDALKGMQPVEDVFSNSACLVKQFHAST